LILRAGHQVGRLLKELNMTPDGVRTLHSHVREWGQETYIVAADGMRAGDTVQSYRAGIPQDLLDSMGGVVDPGMLAAKTAWRGNCLPLHMIPIGTLIYNVGITSRKGGQFCRSAGTYATVVSKDEEEQGSSRYVTVRLQSGEVRRVSKDACATVGVASNPHFQHRQLEGWAKEMAGHQANR
jgi:ribosomal protein L2